jgi:hypothetical protein
VPLVKLNERKMGWKIKITRPQVSDGVGDAAPFDLFDDGGQPAVVDSFATHDLETEDGGWWRIAGPANARNAWRTTTTASASSKGPDSGHVFGQYHSSNHFGTVAVGLPRDWMLLLRRRRMLLLLQLMLF